MLKEKEINDIIKHYTTFLGDLEEINYKPQSSLSVKPVLLLSKATEERPYNVVATVGMSEYKLKGIYNNCELIMLLDDKWKFKMDNINHNWPFELLSNVANEICVSKEKFCYGQYFVNENNKTFCALTDMSVALIAIPVMLDKTFFELKSGKKTINFFVLTTATFDELKLIKHIGGINFIQRYLLPEGENAFIIRNNQL